jgi:hypothetical protein
MQSSKIATGSSGIFPQMRNEIAQAPAARTQTNGMVNMVFPFGTLRKWIGIFRLAVSLISARQETRESPAGVEIKL